VRTRLEVTAIIGGGASGILTALHLQNAGCSPDRLVIIEPRTDLGKGIAYGTTDIGHLLNVRAGLLSALPDDPGHFTAWAAQRTNSDSRSFLPRAWYGEYLNSLLGPVEHIRANAVDLLPVANGVRVVLSDGALIEVDRAVLSPGSSPPVWPRPIGGIGPRWVSDPRQPGPSRWHRSHRGRHRSQPSGSRTSSDRDIPPWDAPGSPHRPARRSDPM
jgi:uncharacterized NAD(P)/FAD-binding protein YdhS